MMLFNMKQGNIILIASLTIFLSGCDFLKDAKTLHKELTTHKLDTNTMYPNHGEGKRYKIDFKKTPKRFDIILFSYADEFFDESDFYSDNRHVSRIIGLPGESLEIRKGDVYINDVLLKQPFLLDAFKSNETRKKIVIDKNCFYVMVDDRNTILRDGITSVVDKPYDSRKIGAVHSSQIEGVTNLQ